MVDRDQERSDAARRRCPTRQPRIVVEQPIERRLDLNERRRRLHDLAERHGPRDVFRRTQDERDHRRYQPMGVGNERVAHMLMAEVAPLQDDRTEALPQSGSLFLLAAQQRDALAVFPHAGQGIAEFGLRLVHALGDGDEAARHQDDRRTGDDRVNDRRDHQVAGDDDGCRRRAERQIATDEPKHPDERHRRDRGAEDADDEVDRRVGGDTRIITDAALGILMVSRHQIELVIVAIRQPLADQMVGQPRRATHAGLSCARTRRRWPTPPWSPQAARR